MFKFKRKRRRKSKKQLGGIIFALAVIILYSIFNPEDLLKVPSNTEIKTSANGTYQITGRVVKVSDGDTINVLQGKKNIRIRLASIDAPETGHGKNRPAQPFGNASRLALAKLVANKEVALICYEKDYYQREICDVPLANGTTANQAQVANGMAWANMQGGGKYLRDKSLINTQKQAKQQKLGLWQQPGAVSPWDWRKKCWKALENGSNNTIC